MKNAYCFFKSQFFWDLCVLFEGKIMKTSIRNTALVLSFLSTTTLVSNDVFAKQAVKAQIQSAALNSITSATKHKLLQQKKHSVTQEAIEVASETQKAIVALSNHSNKEAITILQGVFNKLEVILAKNPGVSLIPLEVDDDVVDFVGSSKDVATVLDETKRLLNRGQIQQARQLLAEMASEIRITTVSIPLGTFPGMIKKAISEIQAEKSDLAMTTLSEGMNTLDETVEIMPLPVFRAEELMTVAANLEHKEDLKQEKTRDEIQKYLDAYKDNLKIAELLGYGSKDDYKILYKEIDSINGVLFTEKSEEIWKRVKDRFADLSRAVSRIGHPSQ